MTKRWTKVLDNGQELRRARLNIIEAVPDAPIQIGNSHIFPLEHQNTAGAGAKGLDLPLLIPLPHAGGMDAKNTGYLPGGQPVLSGFPAIPGKSGVETIHQSSTLTLSGSIECPNQ